MGGRLEVGGIILMGGHWKKALVTGVKKAWLQKTKEKFTHSFTQQIFPEYPLIFNTLVGPGGTECNEELFLAQRSSQSKVEGRSIKVIVKVHTESSLGS